MNNKIFSLIVGVLSVILFWIGWVSLNPSDEKAMARFISVEKLVNNEDKKVKNKLSKSQQAKITDGPTNLNKSSKAFTNMGMRRDAFNKANQANRRREQRFQFGGKKPTSLQPWLTIVLVFLLMPFVIIPFIIKPLQPYFIELTLPRVSN
mgnify:CR=1 FL=1